MSRITRSRLHRPDETACILTLCRPNFGRCYGQTDSSGDWNDGHRKALVESILVRQSKYFCIELVCCVISASDVRQILQPRPDIAQSLTSTEVAERWLELCPSLRTTSVAPDPPTKAEILSITHSKTRVHAIRSHLSDVSWWMRLLCQRVAQRLNSEDGLDGPFHHGRFRSQKLLDNGAINTILSAVNLASLPLDTSEQLTPTALCALAVQLAYCAPSGISGSAVAQQTIAEAPACELPDASSTSAPVRTVPVNEPSANRLSQQPCTRTNQLLPYSLQAQFSADKDRHNRVVDIIRPEGHSTGSFLPTSILAPLTVFGHCTRTRPPPSLT
jgi:hypothetical protein